MTFVGMIWRGVKHGSSCSADSAVFTKKKTHLFRGKRRDLKIYIAMIF